LHYKTQGESLDKEKTMDTQPKPFWKSRKLAYALGTFLAALVVALLPTLGLALEPETVDMLGEMLSLVFVLGFLAIAGHTATDIAAQWQEGVVAKGLDEAAHDLLEALLDLLDEEGEEEPEAPPQEVAVGDTAK